MILQENIQKKAEEYGELASVFLEGAKFALENQWINVKDDLPFTHKELVSKGSSSTKRVIVIDGGGYYFDCMTLCKNGNWKWIYSFNPSHWLSIPKMPKRNKK